MTYLYNAPNISTGFDQGVAGVVSAVPGFTPMILLFVFLVVLLGGSGAQKKRSGSADIPMWATIAGLSTMMVALTMTMGTGLIDLGTLSIVAVVTIAAGFWFFLDRNKNEV